MTAHQVTDMSEQDDAYRLSRCATDTMRAANVTRDPEKREAMLVAAAECAAMAHAIIMRRTTLAK